MVAIYLSRVGDSSVYDICLFIIVAGGIMIIAGASTSMGNGSMTAAYGMVTLLTIAIDVEACEVFLVVWILLEMMMMMMMMMIPPPMRTAAIYIYIC